MDRTLEDLYTCQYRGDNIFLQYIENLKSIIRLFVPVVKNKDNPLDY